MAFQKFVIVGDNHGNEINPEVEAAFFRWLADFNPVIRIHGGDNWNFAALRKKASEAEKREALAPDIDAGNDFFRRLFAGGKQNFFTRGNHDERIWNTLRDGGNADTVHCATKIVHEIESLARKLRVKMLPYEKRLGVLDVAGIRSLHGYASGIGAARKFASVYGSCFYNHTHSCDCATFERYPAPVVAMGVGALLTLDQGYNSAQIGALRHENSFVYGYTDGTHATGFQAKFQNGKLITASEIKAY